MPDARLDDVAIDDLVSEFLAQRRRGERVSISEFAGRHPRWAEEIRSVLPAALALERFKVGRKSSAAGNANADAPPHPALARTRLGDYELLEEIGYGGMGVVYRARQTSLDRVVAVKVLRAGAVAGSKQAKRFARESQAAAALHHNNIVPVYGVGHQDGIHYYVMQLIEGEGLDRVITEIARRENSAGDETSLAPAETDQDRAHRPAASEVARVLLGERQRKSPPRRRSSETETLVSASTQQSGPLHRPLQDDRGASSSDATPRDCAKQDAVRASADEQSSATAGAQRQHSSPRHYWRSVARIGLEAAQALHYAHRQGTLHRDVKPGNLIVDQRGTVWITDFGLAKLMHTDSLTETGDVVGTLRYMAPEQFSGAADARSDVYGLGMTLYELATLRPAFDATGRAGLIDQVMRQEPIRPRKLRGSIPRDLETILLKAISRDPNHRYPSAQELADDLERFLDDRPIRARRVGPLERFWRWCHRNPAVAIPTAAAALLLVLACTVATGGYMRESNLREAAEYQSGRAEVSLAQANEQRRRADENTAKARAERRQAQRQRRLAQENLALALEAIEEVFERIAPSDMHRGEEEAGDELLESEYQMVVTPEDAALLESMLEFYDRFAAANATNLKLQIEAARAHRRVGDIHQRLGQFPEAEKAYGRAREQYARLAEESPEEPSIKLAMASVLNELGIVRKMMRRRNEAQRSHREALAILREQLLLDPESSEISLEMVRSYNLMGYAIWGQRRWSDDDDVRLITQAESNHRKALQLVERLIESDPMNPEYRLTLARSYRDLAPVLSRCGADGVDEVSLNAIDILEGLVAEYPRVPLYRYELVDTLSNRDEQLWGEAGLDEGRRRFERAIELVAQLADEFPSVPEYASRHAYTYHKFGEVLLQQDCKDEAECLLRQAVELRRMNVERFPEVSAFPIYMASTMGKLADLLRQRGDVDEAGQVLEDSIAMLTELEAASAEPVFGLRAKMAENYFSQSRVLRMKGRFEESEAAFAKGREYNRSAGLPVWGRNSYGRKPSGFSRGPSSRGPSSWGGPSFRGGRLQRPPSDDASSARTSSVE
ncbi:MAG: serine/threonine-protein kinase [Pirellulaceae bacterium]